MPFAEGLPAPFAPRQGALRHRAAQVAMPEPPPPLVRNPYFVSGQDDIPAGFEALRKAMEPKKEPTKAPIAAPPPDVDAYGNPKGGLRPIAPAPEAKGYFRGLKSFESGDNPTAVNKLSGATGPYQFLHSTWNGLVAEAPHLGLTEEGFSNPGSEEGARQHDAAIHYYTQKSANLLRPILGRDPNPGELYAAHLFGHAGGPNLVANQNVPLTDLFPKAVFDGNPWIARYKTGADLLPALNDMMGGGQ